MIEDVLPSHVRAFEAFEHVPFATLHPQEAPLVARAVESRRREFATARYCAHQALTALGAPQGPLLATPRGLPVWPDAVRGAITHTTGYHAAAVADASRVAAIGIDAEPDKPLPGGVLESIALPEEIAQIGRLTVRHPGINWDKLLFSTKESVYKAWFPQTSLALEFEDALIRIDPAHRTFSARVLPPALVAAHPDLSTFAGRWLVREGIVLTAITVDAPATGGAPAGRHLDPALTRPPSHP
ncbi:4'-phosphopantetheinyl transferase EntD [Streptomyces sp. CG 926]|uniref:4'-phosphopantetheinyl transferase family protein n=1 Tax=Streptomyces sp. CG 926 TaxID=1882405 RepID=UPI000D6D1BD2|nr:4'-phosphopantetheinyl transferase superfamily protein [Streptomyces sp. CG 926]PWK63496.1 4'-phosphopantetheinyl transferase EntD [Streptomyces sp. CG 926]